MRAWSLRGNFSYRDIVACAEIVANKSWKMTPILPRNALRSILAQVVAIEQDTASSGSRDE
jgi:hypothetical protein